MVISGLHPLLSLYNDKLMIFLMQLLSLNVQNGAVPRQGSGVHLENPEFQTRWYFKYFLGKGSMMFLFSLLALIMAQPGLTDDQFMDYTDMETSLESMGH